MSEEAPYPRVGDRVRLMCDVERYPHFVAPEGATGVVVSEDDVYAVRLDAPLAGAEEWGNEVHWYRLNGDDPGPDVERVV